MRKALVIDVRFLRASLVGKTLGDAAAVIPPVCHHTSIMYIYLYKLCPPEQGFRAIVGPLRLV